MGSLRWVPQLVTISAIYLEFTVGRLDSQKEALGLSDFIETEVNQIERKSKMRLCGAKIVSMPTALSDSEYSLTLRVLNGRDPFGDGQTFWLALEIIMTVLAHHSYK